MIRMYLDIETLPGPESLKEAIAADIAPPGNLTRLETIQKWREEKKPALVEEKYRRTSLEGHWGRVFCVAYIKETPHDLAQGVISGDEPAVLQSFWELARDVGQFVGFNIMDFDLKFLMQRSIIHGVKPTNQPSFARYRSDHIYDVMCEWLQWDNRDHIKLDTLARALGVPSPKEGMDGSQVYDYYLAGRLDEICRYCLRDVHAVRDIYRKMTFQA
jgi:predicted PolB exonuclease-like 3'-5' exonuclease